jgi:hypothetical protein
MPARIAIVCAALLVAACGEDDGQADRPLQPIRLAVMAPADRAVVRDETIDVRGRVDPPRAQVEVRGEPADVRGDEFSARVELDEGANVVDVTASARGRAPTLTAVRIVRRVTVTVPELEGESRAEAVERLEDLGLDPKVRREEGFLDWLQPGGELVCEISPEAGEEVRPGGEVEVVVSKDC